MKTICSLILVAILPLFGCAGTREVSAPSLTPASFENHLKPDSNWLSHYSSDWVLVYIHTRQQWSGNLQVDRQLIALESLTQADRGDVWGILAKLQQNAEPDGDSLKLKVFLSVGGRTIEVRGEGSYSISHEADKPKRIIFSGTASHQAPIGLSELQIRSDWQAYPINGSQLWLPNRIQATYSFSQRTVKKKLYEEWVLDSVIPSPAENEIAKHLHH